MARFIGAISIANPHTVAIRVINMGNMSDTAIAIQAAGVAGLVALAAKIPGLVARAAGIAGHRCRIRCRRRELRPARV